MKTLHLHIGTPKTGTTSIQKALFDNQSALNEYDFGVFSEKPDGSFSEHGIANFWEESVKFYTEQDGTIHGEGFGMFYWGNIPIKNPLDFVTRLASLSQKNIICSSEYFYCFNNLDNNIKQYELAKNLKQFFSSINIYCYIRRQDLYAVSFHQQYSKMTRKNVFGVKALPNFPNSLYDFYNFYKRFSIWGELFGDENIHFRIFDRKQLKENDIVIDFFEWLGLKSIVPQLSISYLNESLGAERTKVGHLLNLSTIKNNANWAKHIRASLDNTGNLLPSRKEAEEFYSHFVESNIELNKRFKISSEYEDIFNHDFSMYPEEPADVWTEESANQAIVNILNSISNIIEENNKAVLKKTQNEKLETILKFKNAQQEISLLKNQLEEKSEEVKEKASAITKTVEEAKKKENEISLKLQETQQQTCLLQNQLENKDERIKILQKQLDNVNEHLHILRKPSVYTALKNIFFQPFLKKKAFAYCNTGKLLEAENITKSIIANNPYMAWAYYILGRVQRKSGDFDLALENYQKAINLEPNTDYFVKEREACIKENEKINRITKAFEEFKPVMTDKEFALFSKYVDKSNQILEFGSGGSTQYYFKKYFSPKSKKQLGFHFAPTVISVESSIDWIKKMKNNFIVCKAIEMNKLHYLHGNIGPVKNWGSPCVSNINASSYYEKPFHYITNLNATSNIDFIPELVFIDGRYRVACALNTILYLPSTKYIMVHDYENRKNYHIIEMFLNKVETVNTMAVFTIKKNLDYNSLYEMILQTKCIFS